VRDWGVLAAAPSLHLTLRRLHFAPKCPLRHHLVARFCHSLLLSGLVVASLVRGNQRCHKPADSLAIPNFL